MLTLPGLKLKLGIFKFTVFYSVCARIQVHAHTCATARTRRQLVGVSILG